MTKSLAGMGVVVTRPSHQAETLCQMIEELGGTPIRFPTLEILAPRNPAAVLAVIDRLDDYDLAIFTSPNAVERALPLIEARGGLPPGLEKAAIGKGSARALARHGLSVDWLPETSDSEGLLALPPLQAAAGKNIVIFRGEGGRELLGETLAARGARVDYAEVYRRARPAANPGELIRRWQRGEIQAVIVASTESLQNLFDLLDATGQQWVRDTPLVVVSERTRQAAQALGVRRRPVLAGEAGDEALVAALLQLQPTRLP